MNGTLELIGKIATQADFIGHFGAFLTHEVRIGVEPYDMGEDGRILYGPPGCEKEPLHSIIRIDGSQRQESVRGIRIPSLQDAGAKEKQRSPFFADVFMLQKSMDVPLAPLMRGMFSGIRREFSSEAEEKAFRKRLQTFGDMSVRSFLADRYGKGTQEKEDIIRPIAEDIYATAERLTLEGDSTVPTNIYYLNSAILFAALDDKASHLRAVDNFITTSMSLFGLKNFVASAVLAERAEKIISAYAEGSAKLQDKLKRVNSHAAVAWNSSLENDESGDSYNFRLYRGMRRALELPVPYFLMDGFLERASRLAIAGADFTPSAEDSLRRAWYAVQRDPMVGSYWNLASQSITDAVSAWMFEGGADSPTIDAAFTFAQIADGLESMDEIEE